eukprot:10233647-Ditylum_brightwellii.AAC.1
MAINQDNSDVKNHHNILHHSIASKPFLFLFNVHNNTMNGNNTMDNNNGNTDIVELNTPSFSDEKMGDDGDNNSAWDTKTVVSDDLVLTLLNLMGADPSFFIEEIMLRFFVPQENIMTAQTA